MRPQARGVSGCAAIPADSSRRSRRCHASARRAKRRRRAKKTGGGNAPRSFELAAELKRVTRVDAIRIEGANLMTIQTVAAELSTELEQWWPTEQQSASRLSLSPQWDVSGGRVVRHTHQKRRNRVAGILWLAATSLLRSDIDLGARFRTLRASPAPPKQSRRWRATRPAPFTVSSPKARRGQIAEPNNSSRNTTRDLA